MPIRLKTGNVIIDTWFLLHQTYQSLIKCEEGLFSGNGLSLQQFHVMHTIILNGNSAMPIAVADWLDRNPNSITMIIDRLEKRGFVKRERDGKDRRATRLVVTPEGEKAFSQFRTAFNKLRSTILSDMSDIELRELARLLNMVREKSFEKRNLKNKIKSVCTRDV
jgi:DNA-binding MarR family transcriptional regulator